MHPYSSLCDDFYINLNLNTAMDLATNRETILNFFERVQKEYPSMRNFYSRDRGDFVLEEDKDQGQYRWLSLESRRICSGHVNPEDVEHALDQHRLVLQLVPYMLSVSGLDCEAMDLLFGFDFTYRGNHNQLVAEALGVPPALERLAEIDQDRIICYEPALTWAMDPQCRLQCRVSVETRTSAYHIRVNDFPEEQLSVYVTARQYGSLDPGVSFEATLEQLLKVCQQVLDRYVVEGILQPLRKTIALK